MFIPIQYVHDEITKYQSLVIVQRWAWCTHLPPPFHWWHTGKLHFEHFHLIFKVFQQSPEDLDMHLVYDVSHNIAKMEVFWRAGRFVDLNIFSIKIVFTDWFSRCFAPGKPDRVVRKRQGINKVLSSEWLLRHRYRCNHLFRYLFPGWVGSL